jgi:hypothetical protein
VVGKVAGCVATTGAVALSVVKVMSLPLVVPLLLVAVILKWYVVAAVKPLMVAVRFCVVLPLKLWSPVWEGQLELVPQQKCAVVAHPLGLTVPFSAALLLVMSFDTALVVAAGAPAQL